MSKRLLGQGGALTPGVAVSAAIAALVLAASGALVGCAGVRLEDAGVGGRTGITVGMGGHSGDSSQCDKKLAATVRDFRGFLTIPDQPRHPDFEFAVGPLSGIVKNIIGGDRKPVYAPPGATAVTNGADYFNQWYRDVAGVNQLFSVDIPLTPDPNRDGVFVFDSDAFFPIDDKGWGNQYQSHNYDFTTEVHFKFPYGGGEVFTFRGDDDVWVFVNDKLAIDLGGVHEAETGSVDLDKQATALGITPGKTYQMDIFHAERHVASSTFHVETTLGCITNIVP